jgi:ABC-2 type transport system ATP-binding protein
MRFGYMPEERGLYPRMALGEQLVYFGALHGLDAADAHAATDGWLERLGLGDRAGERLEALSHGNQQRAQLAAALVHAPDMLVLDEPFAGLDPLAVRTLAEVLRGEAARGAAVLFSSHQLELVEDICEDVAIVDHGRLVASGHVDALRAASQRRRITLRLERAPAGWLPPIEGVELAERHDDELRLRAPRDVDPERVLAAAREVGSVLEFSFGPPSLSELFVELVGR